MNALTFMEVTVEAAVFFGLADENQIQPDVAVAQLEQLAFILRKLSLPDQAEFGRYVSQMARNEERANGRTQRFEFLETMMENLGLDAGE